MKTYAAKPLEVERTWWVVDAEGQTLGRLASLIANLLRGKHKPEFTPNVDTGDFVIVVNAEKITVSGKKTTDKLYRHHTMYPGGLKTIAFRDLLDQQPTKVIEKAVWGMLQHNTLGRAQFNKLNVYAGPTHPHSAQQPRNYDLSVLQKKNRELQEVAH